MNKQTAIVRYTDGTFTSGAVSEDLETLVRVHVEERLSAGEKVQVADYSPAAEPLMQRLSCEFPWLKADLGSKNK